MVTRGQLRASSIGNGLGRLTKQPPVSAVHLDDEDAAALRGELRRSRKTARPCGSIYRDRSVLRTPSPANWSSLGLEPSRSRDSCSAPDYQDGGIGEASLDHMKIQADVSV